MFSLSDRKHFAPQLIFIRHHSEINLSIIIGRLTMFYRQQSSLGLFVEFKLYRVLHECGQIKLDDK